MFGDPSYTNRVTFLLGPDEDREAYPEVSPEKHADEIIEDAAAL